MLKIKKILFLSAMISASSVMASQVDYGAQRECLFRPVIFNMCDSLIKERLDYFKINKLPVVLLLGTEPAHINHFDLSGVGGEIGVFFHSMQFPTGFDENSCLSFDFGDANARGKYASLFENSLDLIVADNYVTHHMRFSVDLFKDFQKMLKSGGKIFLGPDGVYGLTYPYPTDYRFSTCSLDANANLGTRVYDERMKKYVWHLPSLKDVVDGDEYRLRELMDTSLENGAVSLFPKISCKFLDDSGSAEIIERIDDSYKVYLQEWWTKQELDTLGQIKIHFGVFPYRTLVREIKNAESCYYFEVERSQSSADIELTDSQAGRNKNDGVVVLLLETTRNYLSQFNLCEFPGCHVISQAKSRSSFDIVDFDLSMKDTVIPSVYEEGDLKNDFLKISEDSITKGLVKDKLNWKKFVNNSLGAFDLIIPHSSVEIVYFPQTFIDIISMLKIGGSAFLGPKGVDYGNATNYTFRDTSEETIGFMNERVFNSHKQEYFWHKPELKKILDRSEYKFRQYLADISYTSENQLFPYISCFFENLDQSSDIQEQISKSYEAYVQNWWNESGLSNNSKVKLNFGKIPYMNNIYREYYYLQVTRIN